MSAESMSLPGNENVNIIGGLRSKLMEIADPAPDLYRHLSKADLVRLTEVGIKFQIKLVANEIARLQIQTEALGEMQKTIASYK
jgi:hypothetical protein